MKMTDDDFIQQPRPNENNSTRTEVVGIRTPDAVYIGRAGHGESGVYGNPILPGVLCLHCGAVHDAPGETIPCFRTLFWLRVTKYPGSAYVSAVQALKGKKLWCPGCRGRHPCHGDVYVEFLEGGGG